MSVATDFLSQMFKRADGDLFICSFANSKIEAAKFPPRSISTRSVEAVEKFVAKFDEPGRAIYFAVNLMRGPTRSKDQVAWINCLHVDIDFSGAVETRATIAKRLAMLPLPPSVAVFSGHGLHCYWLLDPLLGPEHIERVEALLTLLCDILAGDRAAAEIARVLRLPGSHNSKNGEWLPVHILKFNAWRSYSIEALETWLHHATPVLTRVVVDITTTRKTAPDIPRNIWQQFAFDVRIAAGSCVDIEQLLDAMVYHGGNGNGIDVTHTRVVGGMVAAGATRQEVLDVLLEPTRLVYERDRRAGDGAWNEKAEIHKISAMFKRFERKDQEATLFVPCSTLGEQISVEEYLRKSDADVRRMMGVD